MRYLYSALFYLCFPFVLLRMLWRSRRAPAYRQRLSERFGFFSADFGRDTPVIWLHAVSVGETQAAAPLIEDLLQGYPQYRLVVTTTTPTGSQRVQALFGDRVFHLYCPWDLPGAVRRFLRRTRPRLLLVMETELWPNLLHYSALSGCKIILVNARLSQRSANGYARVAGLTRGMLRQLDVVACQSQVDGDRFLALGLPGAALRVVGNIKFDMEVDAQMLARAEVLRRSFGAGKRPILVAGSTHQGEEKLLLDAFTAIRRACPQALLVLVPRHPERFDAVYALAGREWQVSRRSECDHPGASDDIFLCDTMGELGLMYSVATVALVGGSLVPHGGHNPLEAAAWQVPIVSGSHMYNFARISELLARAGAMLVLEDPRQLGNCLLELLQNREDCKKRGEAAAAVLADNRGARELLLRLVQEKLADS